MVNKSRGRPRGKRDTRGEILAAAAQLFLERGYHRTTLRGIAEAVGVDPANVIYHFGSKRELFSASLSLTFSPALDLGNLLAENPVNLSERLISKILANLDDPAKGGPAVSLLLEAFSNPQLLTIIVEYMNSEVLGQLVEYLGTREARKRAACFSTLAIGIIMSRYVMRVPTIASIPSNEYLKLIMPMAETALKRDKNIRKRA